MVVAARAVVAARGMDRNGWSVVGCGVVLVGFAGMACRKGCRAIPDWQHSPAATSHAERRVQRHPSGAREHELGTLEGGLHISRAKMSGRGGRRAPHPSCLVSLRAAVALVSMWAMAESCAVTRLLRRVTVREREPRTTRDRAGTRVGVALNPEICGTQRRLRVGCRVCAVAGRRCGVACCVRRHGLPRSRRAVSRQLSRCSAPLVVLRERPGSSWRPINDRSGPPRFRNQTIKPYGRPRTRVQRGFTFTLTLHQSRLSARARAHTRTVDHRAVHVRRASLPAWGMGDIGARGM